MEEKAQFGIGFVSGRPNVCAVINNTYKHLLNQTKKFDREVELTIFILYDLSYQKESREEDFYKILPEVHKDIKIVHITPQLIEEQKSGLVKEKIITMDEANLFFGYGYAKARNTLLYNAVINGIDYFLYWDDDEYPVACIKNNTNENIKWKAQNNILGHLENIENADITFGHRCGYNSPLPYMELKNPFHERRIKSFIEAVKNEFMTWKDVKEYLSKNDGIAYADEELMKKKTVSEIQIQGTHKRILGSPLCLNLKHLEKIPAFYNPEGARGEDAFFSLLLNENKVVSVPVYHFHDPFIKFNNVLEGKYPRKIDKTKSNDKSVEQRFYKVARGWIKYRPLYLYATNRENYEKEIKKTVKNLKEALAIDTLKGDIAELEKESAKPDFWDDMENSQKVMQKIGTLKAKVQSYENVKNEFDDALVMIELANEEEDADLLEDCTSSVEEIEKKLESLTLSTLLSGEFDSKNALLTFHAGAGGTEAQDWAEMLFRMYNRWGERHGYKVSTLDYLDGDVAGIKSATILVEGENAYGYLKGEMGIHRLVRVSPFDSSGRRHTSFASVEVMPEIDDDVDVEIRDEDIKMDVYRASGAGGQKVNKTSSAVRLTHIPTGIVVSCQIERSQHQNREVAMRMLKSKLVEIKERENLERIEDIKGDQKEIAWGSQIRSYVFMPYTMVKDHRTNFEMGNITAVMDGDLDGFINAYLKMKSVEGVE